MNDYYGDFTKPKNEIYTELISYFNNYNENYIERLINNLYETKYLIENISVPGWHVFISKQVSWKIKLSIKEDTILADKRLLIYKLLDKKVELDIIRLIIEKYI